MTGTFAVLGDTHFVHEAAHFNALKLGWPGGATEWDDLTRNGWMTRCVTPKILGEIRSQSVDFLLHTGDIIPGHCDTDDAQVEEMEQAVRMLEATGAPFFFSCGSHDGTLGKKGDAALRQTLYPYISEQLGQPCRRSYYAFSRLGCRFISLDYTTWDKTQRDFLEEQLRDRAPEDFVIVFGHPPVVPLARPFFTGETYAREVADLFARYKVHLYFCGHTHNHAASIHRFGGHETAQLMSTPLGYLEAPPIPLSDVRPLLPDAEEFRYGWGFLEDTMPGWWFVNVEESKLTASWHVLGRGVEGVVSIPKYGPADFLQVPSCESTCAPLPDISRIERARIRLAGSGPHGVSLGEALFNGRPIQAGKPLVYFDSRQFIDIPRELFPNIGAENELTVALPHINESVGGAVMELLCGDGRIVRSSVSRFYTTNANYAEKFPRVFTHCHTGKAAIRLSFMPGTGKACGT